MDSEPEAKFDTDRWTWTDRITGSATCVLIIALFLPWFRTAATPAAAAGGLTVSDSGVSAHGYLYLALAVALALVVYLFGRAARPAPPAGSLPPAGSASPARARSLPHEQVLTLAASLNLLLVVLAFVFKPPSTTLVTVTWGYGAILALVMAVIAQAAAASGALLRAPADPAPRPPRHRV